MTRTMKYPLVVLIFLSGAQAYAEDAVDKTGPSKIKKVFIEPMRAVGGVEKDEADLVDGYICSVATDLPILKTICPGNSDKAKLYSDISFKSGGDGCQEGLCVDLVIDKFHPDLFLRTALKKEADCYSVTVIVFDKTGLAPMIKESAVYLRGDEKMVEKIGTLATVILLKAASMQNPVKAAPAEKKQDLQHDQPGGFFEHHRRNPQTDR